MLISGWSILRLFVDMQYLMARCEIDPIAFTDLVGINSSQADRYSMISGQVKIDQLAQVEFRQQIVTGQYQKISMIPICQVIRCQCEGIGRTRHMILSDKRCFKIR